MTNAESTERHSIALWASLTALCVNLGAINLLALTGVDTGWSRIIAAIITAVCVAGSVYTRQRWEDEKTAQRKRK